MGLLMSAYADMGECPRTLTSMDHRVTTVREIGAALRARRLELGLTQLETARRAHVTRQWLVRLERGHPTAELGLVLAVAGALELVLDFRSRPEQVPAEVDLDQILDGLS